MMIMTKRILMNILMNTNKEGQRLGRGKDCYWVIKEPKCTWNENEAAGIQTVEELGEKVKQSEYLMMTKLFSGSFINHPIKSRK